MIEGQTSGDSEALTVDSAASAFEKLLSAEETKEAPTAPPAADTEPPDEDDDEQVDPDEESEDEKDPEDEQPPEPPKLRKVKVDGEEIEVTEEELEKGYSRTADYTRKTQAVAEKDKALEAERAAVREERRQHAEKLTRLEEAITSVTPQEPDWDTLRIENPSEFAAEWAAWQQYKGRLANITSQKNEALAKVQADQEKAVEEYLAGERAALLEAIPEWKDADVAKKERDDLVSFAKSSGYTEDDLAAVRDHRVVTLLRKAMLYDKLQKAKPAAKEKIEEIKAATPGSSRAPSRKNTEMEKRRQRLKSSGSVRDAAALFETMLD